MNTEPEVSDGELTARALAGDTRAFTVLTRRHKEQLYRFIRRYVGDADEAYDVLQESFTAAWTALARYDRVRPFATWLRSIALNKCRDWSRRRAVRRWLTRSDPLDSPSGTTLRDPGLGPEAITARSEELAALDKAVGSLPAGLKEPLLLTVFDELSHEEAGKLLGLSAKAVEVRVYRARKALAEVLSLD